MRRVTIKHGDALALVSIEDCAVDAIVTDPPYGLAFMGRAWDTHDTPAWYQDWCEDWATEAYRVLKPGGHMLAFGGTRTYHRLACGIEDAGFELRDSITWLYGSGFPKSLDVSKAIDKAAGAEREVVGAGPYVNRRPRGIKQGTTFADDNYVWQGGHNLAAPATDDAQRWQGWGTALKPGFEPIVVARKPLLGTVAANVLAHGTGGINVDGCRVDRDPNDVSGWATAPGVKSVNGIMNNITGEIRKAQPDNVGRWPTNVVLSHLSTVDGGDACASGCVEGCPVAELDAQSGVQQDGVAVNRNRKGYRPHTVYGEARVSTKDVGYGGFGGASRFFPTFRYQAKAPQRERPKVDGVAHPTVKPLPLMRWLCRLVTPPNGLILDQFAGSGATVEAAMLEGFRVIAIDSHKPYLPLIRARAARARGAR